jgi:branched-chain amino acid transport system permease protein
MRKACEVDLRLRGRHQWGTLAGGIILGVSQAIGAQINPGWQLLAGHLAFLLILALRPEGLFPKVKG